MPRSKIISLFGAINIFLGLLLGLLAVFMALAGWAHVDPGEKYLMVSFIALPAVLTYLCGKGIVTRRRWARWMTPAAALVWCAGLGFLAWIFRREPAYALFLIAMILYWIVGALMVMNRANRSEFEP